MKIVVLRTERERERNERETEQNKSKPACRWYSVCYDSTLLLSTTTVMRQPTMPVWFIWQNNAEKQNFHSCEILTTFITIIGASACSATKMGLFLVFFLNFQSSSLSFSCCEGWMALVLLQRTSEHSKKQKKVREKEREKGDDTWSK